MSKPTKAIKATEVKDFLRANYTGGPFSVKKSKSGVPTMKGKEELADSVHSLYERFRQAETEFRAEEANLIEVARQNYESNAKGGHFSKSLNFDGSKTLGMQVTFQDKFQDIPIDNEGELRGILGGKFDTMFTEKRILKLNDTSDKTIALLQEKLGPNLFLELFSIDLALSVNDDMDRTQFGLSDNARAFLKQAKPSCKARIK